MSMRHRLVRRTRCVRLPDRCSSGIRCRECIRPLPWVLRPIDMLFCKRRCYRSHPG